MTEFFAIFESMRQKYHAPEAEPLPYALLNALLADSFGSDGIEGFEDNEQEW